MNAGFPIAIFAALAALGSARIAAAGDLDSQSRSLDAAAATRSAHSVAEEVAAPFANLAGSKTNTVALARSLHGGKVIALRTPDAGGSESLVAFDLPGGMGWGDVQTALALVQSTLARHGIRNPTGAQLHAALMGGSITKADGATAELEGVVRMRAFGADWQRVAQHIGAVAGSVSKTLAATQERVAQLPIAVVNENGTPIANAIVGPVIRPSPWANYRPTPRPSQQIEHKTGVIVAGFLR